MTEQAFRADEDEDPYERIARKLAAMDERLRELERRYGADWTVDDGD